MVALIRSKAKPLDHISDSAANVDCGSLLTSVHDIGRQSGNKKIDTIQYVRFERAVIGVAISLLCRSRRPVILHSIEQHESAHSDNYKLEEKYQIDRVVNKFHFTDGMPLNFCQLPDVIRLVLRECLWGRIESGGRKIHFGYDLDVYFVGAPLERFFVDEFLRLGFVVKDVRKSPYSEYQFI
jgi:hypothetical protein